MPRQQHGKRDPTMDEVIRRHERYLEGLIDGLAVSRDDFQARDIRQQLIHNLEDLVLDAHYLFNKEQTEDGEF